MATISEAEEAMETLAEEIRERLDECSHEVGLPLDVTVQSERSSLTKDGRYLWDHSVMIKTEMSAGARPGPLR